MYPGPAAPDLGTFVAQVEEALRGRGHEVDRAVLDSRSGGKLRYLELARRTLRARRPDVVHAHFLVPSGLIAGLEGRDRVRLLGRVPHDDVPKLLAEAHVLCQPSLIEPLGQALLEGLACGRSVVATRIGGPPEFVPPDAGVLVDPLDVDALAAALAQAAALPCPNEAAREATAEHDVL